jgi:5-methyltetrahydrofolate--homocysteine methyltransferase
VDRALAAGLRRQDVFIDPLTLAASAEPSGPAEALRALRLIKRELGAVTVMGVSNVSFGLPQRPLVNRAFLAMALEAGLDLPILNPFSAEMMETIRAADLLLGRDPGAGRFIARYGGEAPAPARPTTEIQPVEERLREAVIHGHREAVAGLVDAALGDGWEALALNQQVLVPALQEVGRRFDRKEFFLPQMILAAETMQAAFARLKIHFPAGEASKRGKILLATVKGDVHDIGKNVVATVLANYGWQVVDLGKNVPAADIVRRAAEEQADFVGLSALMTTTMVEMGGVIQALKAAGVPVKVIVGGAVLSAEYAREIGADGYGRDAMEAVRLVDLLREGDR